jgi:DNA-binding transcriptional regulator YbjK
VSLLAANLSALQGKPEEAIAALAKLEKTGELEDSLVRRLAMAYEELDRKTEADRVAQSHRERNPQSAEAMLGDSVAVYLDAGESGSVASTIVDATKLTIPGGKLRIVREGIISAAAIRTTIGDDRCE